MPWAVGFYLFICVFSSPADVLYWPSNALELVSHQRGNTLLCASQLGQIIRAAHLYAMDNADRPPASFQEFAYNLQSPEVLFCPASFHEAAPTNWEQFDWMQVDYRWGSTAKWDNPTNIACECAVHTSVALVEGSVWPGGYRPGWPRLTAGPLEVNATPGESCRFETRVAPDALQPLSYQWRRSQLSFQTNVVRVSNPDDPRGVYWATNVIPVFTGCELVGRTNASLQFTSLTTNDSGFYSVTLSNRMGVSVSRQTRLFVDPSVSEMLTNELCIEDFCASNLRQLWLFAEAWSLENQNELPPDFQSMSDTYGSPIFGWPLVLFCRADPGPPPPADWADVHWEKISYEHQLYDYPYDAFCRCRVHGYFVQTDGEVGTKPYFKPILRQSEGNVELVV